MRRFVVLSTVALVLMAVAGVMVVRPGAQQGAATQIAIDADDIGGVVASARGPEAGVWVIAETDDLPTKYRKIVVTDDQGRYVLPDLPQANYQVWVRGYGLVDSTAVAGTRGRPLNLTAVTAPTPAAAAKIYPANYWYSLIQVPAESEFPGTGPNGNGIGVEMKTQADFISSMKSGCNNCHQMGSKAIREFPPALGTFPSSFAAWDHRIQVGQDANGMINGVKNLGRDRALKMFADWTDRIAAGELPPAPPRPQGVERNVVVSMWEWGTPTSFVHHAFSTDLRNPTVNAYGPTFGLDWSMDRILSVDPRTNTASHFAVAVDEKSPFSKPQNMPRPSPYWGEQPYWTGKAQPGIGTMDGKARVWATHAWRAPANPDYCKNGAVNVFAKNFPVARNTKQISVYDQTTKQSTLVDTCVRPHHLAFAPNDPDNTVFYSSLADPVVGWVNTRVFDETHDAAKSQGWCPIVVDYNGDGVMGKWTEPDQPADPKLDRRLAYTGYGVAVSSVDGSVWYSHPETPGAFVRFERGSNPPATCKAEVYEPPFQNPKFPNRDGYVPRGIGIDGNGVAWSALAGSGHLASFDRRKCTGALNGPTATGQHCPEGWTLYPAPGPKYKGITDEFSSEYFYDNWVDRFNTSGLGLNTPVAGGSASDSLLALNPATGQWTRLRVPYPQGFFMRTLEGRIDDPNGGWKGRSMNSNYGPNVIWHREGGKGTLSSVVKFQVRPDPLAK